MKRLLGLMLTLTLMLSTPTFACQTPDWWDKWATQGSYTFGTFGNPPIGGNEVGFGPLRFHTGKNWYSFYEYAHEQCLSTANMLNNMANSKWPENRGQAHQFFANELNKCQNHFTRVYRQYAGIFC